MVIDTKLLASLFVSTLHIQSISNAYSFFCSCLDPHPGQRLSFLSWAAAVASSLVSLLLLLPCSSSDSPQHNQSISLFCSSPPLISSSSKINFTGNTCKFLHSLFHHSHPMVTALISCSPSCLFLSAIWTSMPSPKHTRQTSTPAICKSYSWCLLHFPFRHQHISLSPTQ